MKNNKNPREKQSFSVNLEIPQEFPVSRKLCFRGSQKSEISVNSKKEIKISLIKNIILLLIIILLSSLVFGFNTNSKSIPVDVINLLGGTLIDINGTLFVNGTLQAVGIGTNKPTETFVVIGKVNVSDSLNVSGTLQAGSFVGDGSTLTSAGDGDGP